MEIGRNCDDKELNDRMQRQIASKCCSLIYTVNWPTVIFIDVMEGLVLLFALGFVNSYFEA